MLLIPGEIVTELSVKMRAEIVSHGDGQLRGELHSMYFEEPYVFTSLVRMIEMMETTFDAKGFPEKHLLPRTFGKPKKRLKHSELDINKHIKETAVVEDWPTPDGVKCTFDISVRYRHSAEWQGRIYWVERDITWEFMSVLEMLKHIDNALHD
jgi:hypothetical protein